MNPAFLQLVACSVGASEGENSSTRTGWSIIHADLKSPPDHNVIGARKQVAVLAIRILQSGLRGQHRQTGETEQGRDSSGAKDRTERRPAQSLDSVVQSKVGMVGHWRKYNHGFGPGRGADYALDFYIDDGARSQ